MKPEQIPIHDATLHSVEFRWADGIVLFQLSQVGAPAGMLIFTGVTSLHMTRNMEWGPSVSINSVREISRYSFELEMQSGDNIRVCAAGWTFQS